MPAVDSSVISDIEYNAWRQRLDVTFRESGRTYLYFGVPEHMHRALMQAPSIGAFFNARIKDVYPSQDHRGLDVAGDV